MILLVKALFFQTRSTSPKADDWESVKEFGDRLPLTVWGANLGPIWDDKKSKWVPGKCDHFTGVIRPRRMMDDMDVDTSPEPRGLKRTAEDDDTEPQKPKRIRVSILCWERLKAICV